MTLMPHARPGAKCWTALRHLTLVGPQDGLGRGRRGFHSVRVPEQTTRALSEVARVCQTTVSTVLQGAYALVLMSLTGQHDVVFGTARSRAGGLEVAGAESMVGLLINTVPVRATITTKTTTSDLLRQLQNDYNDTLEHQHLALSEIHRITGHEKLFDTAFVYENYPVDTAALASVNELGITRHRQPRVQPFPDHGRSAAGARTRPSRRIRYRRIRRGRHPKTDRAVATRVGGDDRRPRHGGCRRSICWMPVSVIWCCRSGPVPAWRRRWGWRRSCWLRRWRPPRTRWRSSTVTVEFSYRELDEWSTRLARRADRGRGGPGARGGRGDGSLCGVGGGVVGGDQGRWRLCAGGSGPARRRASPVCWTQSRRCAY